MKIWRAIRSGEFSRILEEARSLTAWDAELVEALHHAIVSWCERALALPTADGSNVAAVFDLIGRLRSVHGDDAVDAVRPGTILAWRAFEQLLNERLSRQSHGGALREQILSQRHVSQILTMLDGRDGVPQFAIRERLKSSESTLSQVLARMERAELVVRVRDAIDGRTRLVRLTDSERQRRAIAAPAPIPTSNKPSVADSPHLGILRAFPGAARNTTNVA